jgi:hypothetical protein
MNRFPSKVAGDGVTRELQLHGPSERLVFALIRPDDLRFAEPTYRRFRAAV